MTRDFKSQQPIQHTIDERIISEEDASNIGTVALSKINEEFVSINNENIEHLATAYKPDKNDCLCDFMKVYNLPCRHLLAFLMLNNQQVPMFSLQQIEKRYLHTYITNTETFFEPTKISVQRVKENIHSPNDYSFSNCQAYFEEIFDKAYRAPVLQKLIDKFLTIYEHLQGTESVLSKSDQEAEQIVNKYFSEFTIQSEIELKKRKDEYIKEYMFPIKNMKCTRFQGSQATHPRDNCDLRRKHLRRNVKKKKGFKK